MAQQRDTIKALSPPWLSAGTAERLLYSFGLGSDALLEKLNQAMRAHMPGIGTNTALVYLGNDRVIPQGPFEDDADYAGRLQRAFESWQRAGSRRAVLSQVLAYLDSPSIASDGKPVAAIVGGKRPDWDVYYAGNDQSQPPVHVIPSAAGAFNWDGQLARWWRAWLVLYFSANDLARTGSVASMTSAAGFSNVTGLTGMTAADVGRILLISGAATVGHNGPMRIEALTSSTAVVVSCGLSAGADANSGAITWRVKEYPTVKPGPAWGAPGAVWGDVSRSWGLANPPGLMAGVLSILNQWQSEHSFYPETLIVFSGADGAAGSDISPYVGAGTGNPNGEWAGFSKIVGGVSVPARVFTGTAANAYAKFNSFAGGSRQ